MELALVIVEFVGLFFLSRRITQSLFTLFLLISNRPVAISLTTVILFPGTVIHELSHLFSAEILGVRTGKLTLIPESIDDDHIHAGTVEIQRTDPIRRYIIGLAPVWVGLIILSVLSYFLPQQFFAVQQALREGNILQTPAMYILLGLLYLFFAVSNTMFSSKEDLHGIGPFLVVLLLVGVAAYASGIRIHLTGSVGTATLSIFEVLTRALGVVIIFNLILLLFMTIVSAILMKLLRRTVHRNPGHSVH